MSGVMAAVRLPSCYSCQFQWRESLVNKVVEVVSGPGLPALSGVVLVL